MSCKIWLTKCHPSGLHNVIIIAESLACMCGRRRRGRRKGKAKQIAFDFFAGARVAQLISARPSVREVPSSIPGDHPCFNFSPFCVAWSNEALMFRGGKTEAHRRPQVYQLLLSRVIDVKYGCFTFFFPSFLPFWRLPRRLPKVTCVSIEQ